MICTGEEDCPCCALRLDIEDALEAEAAGERQWDAYARPQ